ncbi:lipopolysaccharide export system protein LptA [Thermosulfuriphilus ammonigenes]|nr:lipopolysaccharide export system protein LptA [Thermosulfuriphilus ammonigenes]
MPEGGVDRSRFYLNRLAIGLGVFWVLMAFFPVALQAGAPVKITSDQLESLDDKQMIIFTGHVVAKKENLTVYADKLVVYYRPVKTDKGIRKKVYKMVALGNVKIVQQNSWVATGGVATYFRQEEKVVLEDNPQVVKGGNVVRGKKITLFLNEDRSLVEAAPGKKVEAIVYPEE